MANVKRQTKKKVVVNHVFKGCREAFLNPVPGGNPGTAIYTATSSSGGAGNFAQVINPLGLTGVVLASGLFANPSQGNIMGPPLRGLYNKAVDFQWYRVTRARFVFVGNVGSTVTGTITMAAYSDPADVGLGTTPSLLSSPNTRTFDFASASTKELSVPIPVDSSWKKVSSEMTIPGNNYPYTASSAASFAVCNTVADLSAGAVQATWIGFSSGGTAANSNIGNFFIDYDVEFKAPIDSSINY